MNGLRKFAVASLIAACLPALIQAQQPTTITGRVTGEAGQPVAGVSVFLEGGGSIGSTTDETGRYSCPRPGARVSGQAARVPARRIGYTAPTVSTPFPPGTLLQN